MANIVLDKSFLRGVSGNKIKNLSQDNIFLMPFALLYELVKDEPRKRAKLFQKFDNEKKYLLLPSFYTLFQYEIDNNKPITLPSDYINQRDYSLHKQLCNETYILSDKQRRAIEGQKKDKDILVNIFFKLIKEYIESKKNTSRKELEEKIIFNKEKLTQDYKELQRYYGKEILDASNFNDNWFIYKWLQVLNLFAIDIAYRYDSINIITDSPKTTEKIIHDILDMEYLVFAISENGFATQESKLIEWYKLLCPNGILYTKLKGKN